MACSPGADASTRMLTEEWAHRNLLRRDPDGYWIAREQPAVSYPEGDSDLCFGIEEGSFWFRHRNAVLIETVRRAPPPADRWWMSVAAMAA